MITTIQPKAKGKPKQQFITQQYECGLYVAVYTDGERIPDQFATSVTEEKFHKDLRAHINTRKATFIKKESTSMSSFSLRMSKNVKVFQHSNQNV